MRHLIALLMKYILLATACFAIWPLFFDISAADILFFSLVLTLIAYPLGDLWILPRFGNFAATFADFGLVFFAAWFALGNFQIDASILNAAFFTALLAALGEALFHSYVTGRVLSYQRADEKPKAAAERLSPSLQAEIAEEWPHDDENREE
jgi:cell division protein FtsW (lipid II flippase)